MSNLYMGLTFLVLPWFWVRAWWLKRQGNANSIHAELKSYSKYYFGLRRKTVNVIGDNGSHFDTCIYVSNHQSHNDIFVVLSAIDKPFRFIAKKELFTNPITGMFMRMSSSYPLDRDDPRQSLTMLKQAVKDVGEGHSVLAFPEGTRSHQKEMGEFKDGIFSVLRKANAPIIPLFIKESFNEKAKVLDVYFGDAILPDVYNKLKGTELSALTCEMMNALKDKAYQ